MIRQIASAKMAVSFGAEAYSSQAEEDAEDNGWSLAKHFKLHLHPESIRNEHGLTLDPLPHGVSLSRVYSDFLAYLIRHTQSFFEDRVIDGKIIWQRHRSRMQFIITHPNGYGVREQAFLRTAATNAGLVTNATAASCVRFVTEAQASIHYCIYHTNLGERLQPGMKFALCDAGRSTVDSTVYSVIARSPLELEEARASACVQAGGIFVNVAAEQFIQRALTAAELHQDDIVDYAKRGVQDFEKNLKRQFSGSVEAKSVEVAGTRVNYPRSGIRRGLMSLEGATVRKFFDVCVNQITASVDEQIQGLNVSYILLVGVRIYGGYSETVTNLEAAKSFSPMIQREAFH
ncbi:heat shock 70 kDa protein 12A, partial [Rhizoctonia solani AG-3 Rhs1AP]